METIVENHKIVDDEILMEQNKVRLYRSWSFWENYETKEDIQQDYSKLLKEVFTFDDLISFWQFWNKYPGSTPNNIFFDGERIKYFFKEKYRIVAMNLFEKNIRPEWEDIKNKKCKIFTLEYVINNDLDKFMESVKESWTKLLCLLIGETMPNSQLINGVRFVDKTKLNSWKKIIFRFEVWANASITDEQINTLKDFLAENFGCSGITIKTVD